MGTGQPDTVAAALADITVLDPAGVSVRLGDLWDTRPVLLAIIRHFG